MYIHVPTHACEVQPPCLGWLASEAQESNYLCFPRTDNLSMSPHILVFNLNHGNQNQDLTLVWQIILQAEHLSGPWDLLGNHLAPNLQVTKEAPKIPVLVWTNLRWSLHGALFKWPFPQLQLAFTVFLILPLVYPVSLGELSLRPYTLPLQLSQNPK